MRRVAPIAVLLVAILTGCGGSSTPSSTPSARSTPDLAGFLALPVATPSACPSSNGTTVGRRSPWAGTVDISVYLRPSVSDKQITALGHALRANPLIARTYYESRTTAYREFQRLYACWAGVRRSAAPASYRLILTSGITIAQRDRLVGRLAASPVVDGVTCDASIECLAVVSSPTSSRSPQ